MSVWGVEIETRAGVSQITVVEAAGPRETPTIKSVLVQAAPSADLSQSLRELAAAITGQLREPLPTAVFVLTVGLQPSSARRMIQDHGRVEGAVLAAARVHVPVVRALEGKDLARAWGGSWPELRAVAAGHEGSEKAIATALGGLAIAGEI